MDSARLRGWAVESHEVDLVSLLRPATVRHSVRLQRHLGRGHSCQVSGRRHSQRVARLSGNPRNQLSVNLPSQCRVPLLVRHHSLEVVGVHSDLPLLWALRALHSANHLNLVLPSQGLPKRRSPHLALRLSQREYRPSVLRSNSRSSDPTRSQASLASLRALHKLVKTRRSRQVRSLPPAKPTVSALRAVQLRRTLSEPRRLRRHSGHHLSRMETLSHS